MEFHCYRCGQPGHIKSECPSARTDPDPAPGLAAAPSNRPENKPVPLPVPADQRAQYDTVNPHAEALRQQMGWTLSTKEAREMNSRAIAAEQVAESRAKRTVLP